MKESKHRYYNPLAIVFFLGIVLPVLLSFGLVLYDLKRLLDDNVIGYLCWASSFIVFCVLFVQRYFYAYKEEQELFKHLVDDEQL